MKKSKYSGNIYLYIKTKEKRGNNMILFNISDPLTLLLMVLATALLIFLAQEIKKSNVAAITLFAYLGILVMHVIQISTLSEEFR